MKTIQQIKITSMLVVVLLFSLSCSEEKKQEIKPPELKVYEVVATDIPITMDFVGQTYGLFDISIRARVEGFLEGIHFEEGSNVQKGKLLYTIDPQPFEAKVTEQMSRVAQAKTSYVKAESDLNRIRPLAEINAVSQSDLDGAVARYEATIAEVKAAEASLRSTRIELGYTKIYSPIRGIIGITEAKVGEFVGREPNPVVLNGVSRVDTILVRFSITESQYLTLVRLEDVQQEIETKDYREENLRLILADGSMHEYPGGVDFADRSINPNTGALLLQASFPNPKRILKPGQFAKVRALFQPKKDGIWIPQRCITELQGIFQVMVVKEDNTLELRTVETGPKIGNMWTITSGLKAGEKIILEGLQLARPGMTINPVVTDFEIIREDI